ncbi:N-acetylglucosamine-6-phosphate deacetylase, partial [Mytilus galloprovincialis]
MGAKNKRKHAQEDVNAGKTKGKIYKFYNCQLLRDHKLVKDNLYVRDGVIINPEKLFFEEKLPPDEQIDCKGAIICPGFIDIQINGAFGVDFSCDVDTIEEGLKIVAKGLLPHGVTSFCPTIISSKEDIYRKIVPKIKKVDGNKEGAGILGAFGVDFSCDVDTIEEGLKIVAKGLLPHGVTSFCPTIISSKEDIYRK